MRRFWIIGFIISSLIFGPSVVFAAKDFDSSISLDYVYNSQGIPTVTQKISFKNLTSEKYITSYQFNLLGEAPTNIYGRDSIGPLKINTSKNELSGTTVTVNFNDQVVGKGNTLDFSLDYSGDPVTLVGQVWQVVIPALSTNQVFDKYQLSLTIPDTFGTAASLNPNPQKIAGKTYIYNDPILLTKPIYGAFGNFQSFDFSFVYKLENSTLLRKITEVPIPPDTPYQHIILTSIDPKPTNVHEDDDGNWLAEYSLDPKQGITVTASGHSYIQPVPAFSTINESNIDLNIYKNFTLDDQKIIDLAKKYTTPTEIFSSNPDLFVAIARAAGIPARETVGYKYPDNALHSWPQYWDSNIQNWVNLNFDVNHLSFYINGQTTHEFQKPSISIAPSVYTNPVRSRAIFYWDKPFQFFPIFSTPSSLVVTNPSGQAIYNLAVSVAAQNLGLDSTSSTIIPVLPPYSTVRFPVVFSGSFVPSFTSKYLAVSVDNQQMTYNISSQLFIFWHASIILTSSIFIIFMAYFTQKAWGLYLQRHSKSNYLRRKSKKSS